MSDQYGNVFFRLVRYNPRRKTRGARAAEVEITSDGESIRYWMNERDIRANIKIFGAKDGLAAALAAYVANKEIEEATT